jgi:D-glycero-D-manno-heptose 1,7-bisphosphate phosphatase
MLLKAIQEYNIDPSKSFMIGDHERDIIAGNSVGASTILIHKERKKGLIKGKHDHEFKNLLSACEWIVNNK